MPIVRTIWVQTFPDERTRDGCFEWMSGRFDRWNAWGDIAYRASAVALTQHLFSLLLFDMVEERNKAGGERPATTGKADEASASVLSIEYREQ
ncbi:hypothetical protein [Sphingomonas sp. Ant20]|uniref:hypothetical protein n=1 Tax=Sphingomonas sp. Ant20 TaxID=104605 RepID=UPI000537D3E1|nr:hypothetical protein [Sphingomonas sp. Ant20]KHA63113.1 hypothetical protein NI18_18460 [Sphingomonas sp. Ant20]